VKYFQKIGRFQSAIAAAPNCDRTAAMVLRTVSATTASRLRPAR